MRQYNGEIIALGTELLLGQIANTNAKWLSNELAKFGINLFYHTVVGDNIHRVLSTFQAAETRSNIVIVTGGLGPTEDDMTRDAFQQLTNLQMYEHQLTMEKITNYFQASKRKMTPNNRKQALVFETAKVLHNETGMAPGMIVFHNDVYWIFLPGVPREMKSIFANQVSPFLKSLTNQKEIITSKVLRFIGIGEADLEHRLSKLIKKQSNPTIAPLAQKSGMTVRLTVKAKSYDEANKLLSKTKEDILDVVGDYFYGIDDDTIQEVVVHLLTENNLTISAAESITGGLFMNQLISAPGASQVAAGSLVSYRTEIKQDVLHVAKETIETHGVVSKQCAREMAINVKNKFQTNIGISFTGVAGPDSLEGHDIGTVFMCICTDTEIKDFQFVFSGDRNQIRERASLKGFELLYRMLK
ncbi:MAG TPA: competence/damage-inducible protein A [Bacillota bacterium]|nr:competence/damage-inducible protein A [Bacillota bacterium]